MSFKQWIIVSITFCCILGACGCDGAKRMDGMTLGQLVKDSGGEDNINKELQSIFTIFGTNELVTLKSYGKSMLNNYFEMNHSGGITNFPAIFTLGDTVQLWGCTNGEAPCIRIRFGRHLEAQDILIFSPYLFTNSNAEIFKLVPYVSDSNYIRVSTNIFLLK